MPENFVQIKHWIRDAARGYGAHLTREEIRGLASAYITEKQVREDIGDGMDCLTYSDETGAEAVKRWLADVWEAAA